MHKRDRIYIYVQETGKLYDSAINIFPDIFT